MIRISLGNVGSGKTACEVRNMMLDSRQIPTYTNIQTRGLDHVKPLTPDLIIKKEFIGEKKTGEAIYDYKLNIDFWKEHSEALSIVLDEAHTIVNARRSLTKVNIVVTDWLALVRRVVGSSSGDSGSLVFITQLDNRLDVIAREMATQIRYHLCHYQKTCLACFTAWLENSDMPEPRHSCPRCGGVKLKKHHHRIEVWHFAGMDAYKAWRYFGMRTAYNHYFIHDIEQVFGVYDTLQWDNMFTSVT